MKGLKRLIKNHGGMWLCIPIIFSLAALSPEYIAPFMSAFIAALVIKHTINKSHPLRLIGFEKYLLIYLLWIVIGLFYTKSVFSGLVTIGIWALMLFAFWLICEYIDSRVKLDTVILAGALTGGVAGGIGIVQIILFHYGHLIAKPLEKMFNPFWKQLNIVVADVFVNHILPERFRHMLPRTSFIAISDRASSTFSNPIFFATFLIMIIPLAMYGFLYFKSKKKKWVCFICVILSTLGVFVSYTRGAYIALVIMFISLLLHGGRKRLFKLLTGAAGVLAFALIFMEGPVKRFLTIFNGNDLSVGTRSKIWDAAFEMISQKPIFGYGTGTDGFKDALHNIYGIKQPHAHNIFLQILLENGAVGLVLFLTFLIMFSYSMLHLYRKGGRAKGYAVTFFASVVGFFTCGMTDYLFYGLKPMQYLIMILGLAQAAVLITNSAVPKQQEQMTERIDE